LYFILRLKLQGLHISKDKTNMKPDMISHLSSS
jgi:hypothetical protein